MTLGTLRAMDLVRIELGGGPARVSDEAGVGPMARHGVLGVDVAARAIDGVGFIVVQVLLDDDLPGFDPALLDAPLVAELVGPDGDVAHRELLDHDRLRHQLLDERRAGVAETRGVLVTTGGELPPPWVRLAFLPVPVDETADHTLVVRRTTRDRLTAAVEAAHAAGDVSDDERRALLVSIDQHHPPG